MNITGYPLLRCTANQAIDSLHINQGEIFFLVASKSNPDTSHIVRWNYGRCSWQCNCPATVDNCRHVKMVSAWSKDHKYSDTHPNGCPAVVKTPPCKVEHKITEVEKHSDYIIDSKHSVWYCFPQEKWHCSCSSNCTEHIEIVKNKMHREAQASLAKSTIETVLVDNNPPCTVVEPVRKAPKRKRKDLLDKITEERDHKFQILGEIREIQERASSERMMKAALTKENEPFRILK